MVMMVMAMDKRMRFARQTCSLAKPFACCLNHAVAECEGSAGKQLLTCRMMIGEFQWNRSIAIWRPKPAHYQLTYYNYWYYHYCY